MKLKLTRSQFTAIYNLLKSHLVELKPHGIEAVMLHDILMGIYEKFYYRDFDIKKKYSVPLTDAQACAFYFYFSRVNLEELTYEKTLVQTINNQIHQKYA